MGALSYPLLPSDSARSKASRILAEPRIYCGTVPNCPPMLVGSHQQKNFQVTGPLVRRYSKPFSNEPSDLDLPAYSSPDRRKGLFHDCYPNAMLL